MRLQTKLTLAFAFVALVPIAALTGFARVWVARYFDGEFRRRLDEAGSEVEKEYRRTAAEVRRATLRVACPDDPTIGPLLLELHSGSFDDARQRALAERAAVQMRALGFDVFEIVDERGTVLAAGHFPGRVGDLDPEALTLAQRAHGDAALREVQLVAQGSVKTVLALVAAHEVRAELPDGAGPKVVVVGGRTLGMEFLREFHYGARLLSATGGELLSRTYPSFERYPRRIFPLNVGDGEVAARVEVAVYDGDLPYTLTLISVVATALAAGGLALALLLGALVARRISGPLLDLAEGAQAISRGQLDLVVPVRSTDEVGQLTESFNGMTRDLKSARADLVRAERIAAWREIAQRIAHEIKNPLTPIQMAIETLQRSHRAKKAGEPPRIDFDELFDESSRTILDEVARLKHIVAEFSSFARLPAPSLAPCDVGEVVEASLSLYTGGAVQVERSLAPDLPPALADRDQLAQVLWNLLENARDAVGAPRDGAAPGRINVCTRLAHSRIEIEVADSGPGLSEEARGKIFTPYYTTKARGTGLGLAIVHRIVSDHGGEIRVGGAVGQGAIFTVALLVAEKESK